MRQYPASVVYQAKEGTRSGEAPGSRNSDSDSKNNIRRYWLQSKGSAVCRNYSTPEPGSISGAGTGTASSAPATHGWWILQKRFLNFQLQWIMKDSEGSFIRNQRLNSFNFLKTRNFRRTFWILYPTTHSNCSALRRGWGWKREGAFI